ncbi:MAG: hypothetical protein ACIARR_11395 [Phycisphaerales bacterium JB059]
MPTREAIIEALRAGLEGRAPFRAAYLGGSDATGRVDALSDIDLVCLVSEGDAEAGFARIEEALGSVAPIERRWRVPSPTWHGGEQAFYQLEGCEGFGLVDVVLIAFAPGFEFFVRERHGEPRVLFDPEGLIGRVPLDRASHEARRRARLENAAGKFALLAHLGVKEARRGRVIDAMHFYQSLALQPLVDVLRAVHCPDRFDFGMRYLREDLPAGVVEEIERLAYPGSVEEIPALVERARALMEGALKEGAEGAGAG